MQPKTLLALWVVSWFVMLGVVAGLILARMF